MSNGHHEAQSDAPDDDLAARLAEATELLESIVRDRGMLGALSVEERTRLLTTAGDVHNPDLVQRRLWAKSLRRKEKAAKLPRDESALAETGIRVLREKPVYTTPNVVPPTDFEQADLDEPELRELIEPQHCYVCKEQYGEIHPFYDQLCATCGELNFRKRTETADLHGRVALLTGGRVKIGYQAGIKLLRAGAHLIVTTRFPRDAATRYAQESDFDDWGDRLEIFGLDLRHTPSVEGFCEHLRTTHERLDFIVNNACQTVRRPSEFYRHMLDAERASARTMPKELRGLLGAYEGLRRTDMLPSGVSALAESAPSPLIGVTHWPCCRRFRCSPTTSGCATIFSGGETDQDLQQVDLRERNSWRLLLAEVSSVELLRRSS